MAYKTQSGVEVMLGWEFLVPRVLKVLDTDRIPIRDLIAFRRREEMESKGVELRALRHRYREHVEKLFTISGE